jgi:hypothetical protein
MRLLALSLVLRPMSALAGSPSFDCANAESAAGKALCADARLAAPDRETARLCRLAVEGPHMIRDRMAERRACQRGWIKACDECGQADGASESPRAPECPDLPVGMAAVFIRTEPAIAALAWLDRSAGLSQTAAASGLRCEGRSFDGDRLLRTQGDSARFERRKRCGTALSGSV